MSRFVSSRLQSSHSRWVRGHRGFTLVELLIVIAIIGILVGLLAAGVNAARLAIMRRAQTAEINNIANAVEAYRTKYGDYPPDGSSWPIMEAHLRQAFPEILQRELELLNPAYSKVYMPHTVGTAYQSTNEYIRNDNDLTGTHPYLSIYVNAGNGGLLSGRVFDSAEALVFFLGGFSSDPQRPITGPGGPLVLNTAGTAYLYNVQRQNGQFEFKLGSLTLDPTGYFSVDETLYGEGVTNDLMPVYIGQGLSIAQGGVPITYFDNRTYAFAGYFNFYTPGSTSNSPNCARPYLSSSLTTLNYANAATFQILSPGYDRLYGCQSVAMATSNGLSLFSVPDGNRWVWNTSTFKFDAAPSTGMKYFLTEFGNLRPDDDNISNFINGPIFAEAQ